MQTIKFRMWDGDRKSMSPVNTIAGWMFDSFAQWKKHADEESSVKSFFENIVPLQFTGLLDKNGEEIYEGDILGFDEGIIIGKQTGFARYVVKFGEWDCGCGDYYCSESGLGFYLSGYNGYRRENGKIDKYEYDRNIASLPVLGNIYENPDLLNQ